MKDTARAVKRHGCPSHGIGMTPDEKELWVTDCAHNRACTSSTSRSCPRRRRPASKSEMSRLGDVHPRRRVHLPSTGEVIETSPQEVVTLKDETGRQVQSEKLVEIDFAGVNRLRVGHQFGVGRIGR